MGNKIEKSVAVIIIIMATFFLFFRVVLLKEDFEYYNKFNNKVLLQFIITTSVFILIKLASVVFGVFLFMNKKIGWIGCVVILVHDTLTGFMVLLKLLKYEFIPMVAIKQIPFLLLIALFLPVVFKKYNFQLHHLIIFFSLGVLLFLDAITNFILAKTNIF